MTTSPEPGRSAILLAAAMVVAGVAIYGLAVWTAPGQHLDSLLMGAGFGLSSILGVNIIALAIIRDLSLATLLIVVCVRLVRLAMRRCWWFVTRSAAFIVGAYVGARLLRDSLPRPDLGDPVYPYNTWPSAHAATATALVLVAAGFHSAHEHPVRSRRVWTVVLAVVAGLSVAALAHRPSDVLCSILFVGAASLAFLRSPAGRALRTTDDAEAAQSRDVTYPPWLRLGVLTLCAVGSSVLWIVLPVVYLGVLVNLSWLAVVCIAAMATPGLRPGWDSAVLGSGRAKER